MKLFDLLNTYAMAVPSCLIAVNFWLISMYFILFPSCLFCLTLIK